MQINDDPRQGHSTQETFIKNKHHSQRSNPFETLRQPVQAEELEAENDTFIPHQTLHYQQDCSLNNPFREMLPSRATTRHQHHSPVDQSTLITTPQEKVEPSVVKLSATSEVEIESYDGDPLD